MGDVATVAKRVRDILEAVDTKIYGEYGEDLPAEGTKALFAQFDAEDDIDVEAVGLLESRGLARWVTIPGVGHAFYVEALASLRSNVNASQAKATLGLAARIDALEGMVEKLVGQNERLLATMSQKPPKALPAAKKPKVKKAAKKKGGARG
jgi:hypothetical protein